MRYSEILNESMSPKQLEAIPWFHGSKNEFDVFDPIRATDGHAQEGPGFYLTSNENDAHGHGPFVMKFHLRINKLVPMTGKPKEANVARLMKASPVLNDVLENWDENPRIAFQAALDTMMNQTTPKEVFEQVWYDFYRNHPVEWLNGMIGMGYTGIVVPRTDVLHFICFDQSAATRIKI